MAGVVTAATIYAPRAPAARFGPVAGVDVHVALGYYPEGDDVSRWNMARWDTAGAEWEGAAPLDDVTCDLVSVNITEGRDAPLERFRPATCTVVLFDPEGRYSPWATAPDPATYAAVRVGIDVVVWAMVGTTRYPRFRGIVTTIVDTFPDPDVEPGEGHTVTLQATDYLSVLAAYDGVEQSPQGDGELTGARIARIVANAEYVGALALDSGTVRVQATTLAQNALDTAGLTVDTETGAMWCDRDGVLVFRDRNGIVSDPHYTTVQAVFGDTDDGPDDEICYTDIELASDTDKIKNVVSVSNVGGTAVTRSDLTSVSLYRPRTYQRFDLIHVDPLLSPLIAQRHLDFYLCASNRIESLAINLAPSPTTTWPPCWPLTRCGGWRCAGAPPGSKSSRNSKLRA